MKHDSRHGTTCWFCGHPGTRTKTIEHVSYRACDTCRLAKGTREEIREKRNADILAMQQGTLDYTPVYWPPAEFERIFREHNGLPSWVLDQLRWIEYADSTWEATKARAIKGSKHYQAEYYKKLREERKQQANELEKWKNE